MPIIQFKDKENIKKQRHVEITINFLLPTPC